MAPIRSAAMLLLCGFIARAADPPKCLWMNAATAAGALGGSVFEHFSPVLGHQDVDGTCTFTGITSPASELQTEVVSLTSPADFAAYRDRCANRIPLRGIGNEAFACAVKPPDSREHASEVIGRVRNRLFTLHLRLFDPSVTAESCVDKARRMADIVAGNLF